MPWVDLQCVIVVFSDQIHLLFDGILHNLSGDQYLSLPYHINSPYPAYIFVLKKSFADHVCCMYSNSLQTR